MRLTLLAFIIFCSYACKKEESTTPEVVGGPQLIFKFKFDSTQARLNNLGAPSVIPSNHGAQSPMMQGMSAHYIEFAADSLTWLGAGKILYRAQETTAGGSNAIDFSQAKVAANGEVFFTTPIASLGTGTFKWIRVSLAYQNYDIKYLASGLNLTGRVASFIGYNTYITSHKVKDSTLIVNGNRAQGYWAFETNALGFGFVNSGQAPAGATTVPNPLAATSPIPAGSCVVTGKLDNPLIITGAETNDIVVTISLSTNKSFEWKDAAMNNTFEPLNGDTVIDMGIRGLKASYQ